MKTEMKTKTFKDTHLKKITSKKIQTFPKSMNVKVFKVYV